MTPTIQSRPLFLLTPLLLLVLSLSLQAQTRSSPLPTNEQLLAIMSYSESGVTRTLSLWRVPLAQPDSRPLGEGTLQWKGLPPNTAFVLIDSSAEYLSGFAQRPRRSGPAGNLVWAQKVYESTMPQAMVVVSGSIAWHEGQKRVYVTLSHSGSNWERLQVFQVDPTHSLASFSPTSLPREASSINSSATDEKPFAEWNTEFLSKVGLFQVSQVKTIANPEFLIVQLFDLQAFASSGGPKGRQYRGELPLRLNLKDRTFTQSTK